MKKHEAKQEIKLTIFSDLQPNADLISTNDFSAIPFEQKMQKFVSPSNKLFTEALNEEEVLPLTLKALELQKLYEIMQSDFNEELDELLKLNFKMLQHVIYRYYFILGVVTLVNVYEDVAYDRPIHSLSEIEKSISLQYKNDILQSRNDSLGDNQKSKIIIQDFRIYSFVNTVVPSSFTESKDSKRINPKQIEVFNKFKVFLQSCLVRPDELTIFNKFSQFNFYGEVLNHPLLVKVKEFLQNFSWEMDVIHLPHIRKNTFDKMNPILSNTFKKLYEKIKKTFIEISKDNKLYFAEHSSSLEKLFHHWINRHVISLCKEHLEQISDQVIIDMFNSENPPIRNNIREDYSLNPVLHRQLRYWSREFGELKTKKFDSFIILKSFFVNCCIKKLKKQGFLDELIKDEKSEVKSDCANKTALVQAIEDLFLNADLKQLLYRIHSTADHHDPKLNSTLEQVINCIATFIGRNILRFTDPFNKNQFKKILNTERSFKKFKNILQTHLTQYLSSQLIEDILKGSEGGTQIADFSHYGFHFNSDQFDLLLYHLQHTKTVPILSLRGNIFSSKQIHLLAHVLCKNTTINELDLREIFFNEEKIFSLIELVRKNSNIVILKKNDFFKTNINAFELLESVLLFNNQYENDEQITRLIQITGFSKKMKKIAEKTKRHYVEFQERIQHFFATSTVNLFDFSSLSAGSSSSSSSSYVSNNLLAASTPNHRELSASIFGISCYEQDLLYLQGQYQEYKNFETVLQDKEKENNEPIFCVRLAKEEEYEQEIKQWENLKHRPGDLLLIKHRGVWESHEVLAHAIPGVGIYLEIDVSADVVEAQSQRSVNKKITPIFSSSILGKVLYQLTAKDVLDQKKIQLLKTIAYRQFSITVLSIDEKLTTKKYTLFKLKILVQSIKRRYGYFGKITRTTQLHQLCRQITKEVLKETQDDHFYLQLYPVSIPNWALISRHTHYNKTHLEAIYQSLSERCKQYSLTRYQLRQLNLILNHIKEYIHLLNGKKYNHLAYATQFRKTICNTLSLPSFHRKLTQEIYLLLEQLFMHAIEEENYQLSISLFNVVYEKNLQKGWKRGMINLDRYFSVMESFVEYLIKHPEQGKEIIPLLFNLSVTKTLSREVEQHQRIIKNKEQIRVIQEKKYLLIRQWINELEDFKKIIFVGLLLDQSVPDFDQYYATHFRALLFFPEMGIDGYEKTYRDIQDLPKAPEPNPQQRLNEELWRTIKRRLFKVKQHWINVSSKVDKTALKNKVDHMAQDMIKTIFNRGLPTVAEYDLLIHSLMGLLNQVNQDFKASDIKINEVTDRFVSVESHVPKF